MRIVLTKLTQNIDFIYVNKQVSHCVSFSLYAANEGLHGQNVLQSVVDWYCYVIAHNLFAYIA